MSDLLNQASLVMVPSGYKEDTVYSVVPTDGSGDLAFTRASNGTRVNSAGLVEVVPWNLATNSENFTLWNLANVTVTANDLTAPNGTLTADKLTISNNANDVKQTISVMPNSVYTWTFYVYGGTALGQQGRFYDNTNGANIEYYSYSSSVVLGQWVKIERTFTTPSGCYEIQAWALAATSTIGTMWVWGAQLNIGSTAKPYFPTTDRLNVPRLTYQNGGGGCPSLLLEKQSTNLLSYSEQLDNGFWTPLQITITANNTTSPDGTQNADKITEDAVNGVHLLYNTSGVSAGAGTWTSSIFYKKGTRRYFAIKMQIGSSSYTQVYDADGLTTGGSSSNGLTSVSSTIVSIGNGWVRATLTGTDASGGGSGYGIFSLSDSATPTFDAGNFNPTYSGSSSEYGFFWGAQLEASSYATSYIPTTSSSATRVADVCRKTGISSLIGQTSGSVFVESYVQIGMETQVFWMRKASGGFYGDFMTVICDTTGTPRLEGYKSGSNVVYIVGSSPLTMGFHKFAIAYSNNDFVLYVDGVQIGIDTSGTPPECDELYIDQYIDGGTRNTAKKEVVLFKTRLTNAELASLTTI